MWNCIMKLGIYFHVEDVLTGQGEIRILVGAEENVYPLTSSFTYMLSPGRFAVLNEKQELS